MIYRRHHIMWTSARMYCFPIASHHPGPDPDLQATLQPTAYMLHASYASSHSQFKLLASFKLFSKHWQLLGFGRCELQLPHYSFARSASSVIPDIGAVHSSSLPYHIPSPIPDNWSLIPQGYLSPPRLINPFLISYIYRSLSYDQVICTTPISSYVGQPVPLLYIFRPLPPFSCSLLLC